MKKGTLIMARMLVMAVVFVMLIGYVNSAEAKTLYVNGNNTTGVEDGTPASPYKTIQRGVNAAANDDTIQVAPGVYPENVTINSKALKLYGENPALTTIQGTTNTVLITGTYATDSRVEVAGFTITGGATAGIQTNSPSVIAYIHNNNIVANKEGVWITVDGTQALIFNCTILGNTANGVYLNSNLAVASIYNSIIVQNAGRAIYSYDGTAISSYNNLWSNTGGNSGTNYGAWSDAGSINNDPQFLTNYQLAASSPSHDAGRPFATDNDPDGTRNDQGAYGGPGAAGFWPFPAGGPVVTIMTVSPPSVAVGGIINLKATGKIR